ncbi:tetratricopeptide repeat protein [Sphingomonas sp. ASV193]|uniref:tetratricopeptide repeat protein n=1 Tax=Sphingomonas sp. ASV193 TaxID=3144405 RepID=UPI0032E89EC4
MRFSPLLLAFGLAASTMSGVVSGQKPDDQIAPRSVELTAAGNALLAAGKYQAAEDQLETALAVDPKNRAAFVALARVSVKERLYGNAIRLTNKALEIDPTDRDALGVQGEAMVAMGALPRARETLAKLQKLCVSGCPQVASLNAAIARGPAAMPAPATSKKD